MPKNHTEWMAATHVVVHGHAKPRTYTAEDGDQNEVACIQIQRLSGIGTLIIQGRPEDLVKLAQQFTDEAARIVVETESSPGLRSLYGRT